MLSFPGVESCKKIETFKSLFGWHISHLEKEISQSENWNWICCRNVYISTVLHCWFIVIKEQTFSVKGHYLFSWKVKLADNVSYFFFFFNLLKFLKRRWHSWLPYNIILSIWKLSLSIEVTNNINLAVKVQEMNERVRKHGSLLEFLYDRKN